MEHSPNEIGDVLVQLQASQSGHAEPMVRVPWNEQVTVKRVLDLGAQSILFPYVQVLGRNGPASAAARESAHLAAECRRGARGRRVCALPA